MPEPPATSQRFVILITEPTDHPALDILRSIGEVRLGHRDRRYTDAELAEALKDCDAVLITSRDRITRATIEGAPRLKVISKFGARPEKVDLEAAAERGVKVLSTPLANPDSVAEHVVLVILAIQRRLCEVSSQVRGGQWRNLVTAGTELSGKTVGLVGFGNVGSRVAARLGGFNVRILAYDPWADQSKAAGLNVEFVDLDHLLRNSDVISLHAMVTADNYHMIGEAQLGMMKPTSILINTARGPLVDESALVKALQEHRIAGAGLDVYEEEPILPTNPLLRIDTVLATPHTAAHTREAIEREITWAAEDVKRVLLGEPPQHC
jgi:D-3-phosphoglycerate dehydrogenase / 2-oxoglutarate reductase